MSKSHHFLMVFCFMCISCFSTQPGFDSLRSKEGEMEMNVRVGMIGVGGVAQYHLKNISGMEEADLVAVCDLSDAALNAAVTTYGAKGYKDYREMLREEKLDAVYVAIPPFAHGEIEDHIIAQGIHLFVEKPVELHLEAAKRKLALIKQAGIIHASGYCLRYIDAMEDAKRYLVDKRIGLALAYRMGKTADTPWFRVQSKSGGQLVEQATHQVDTLRYLIGDITEVYAKMKLRHLGHLDHYDIADIGTTTFEFADGAIGNIVTSTGLSTERKQTIDIMGENFRVSVGSKKVTIVENDKVIADIAVKNDKFLDEDRSFIEAIRTGDQSKLLADYESGMETLAVTLAANRSVETGRPVRINERYELIDL
jgi:predicted dehydrogenase